MTEPQPVESVFSRAWELLTRNWIIVVPGIVIGAIVGVLNELLGPHVVYSADGSVASVTGSFGSGVLLGLIGTIAYIATVAYTTGMAGAAWQRGSTTLADGSAILQRDAARIFLVAICLIVLGAVAAVLAIFTLGLAILAFFLFTLYVFPSAIVGDRGVAESISESFRITLARFVPTLILGILIFVMRLLAGIIGGVLHIIPFLGPIVGGILVQIVISYVTLAIVGEYVNLRAAGAIPPAPATPGGPTV